MKKRKYEKVVGIFTFSFFIWIIELIFFTQLFHIKITKYTQLNMVVTNKNEGVILMNKNEKKTLYNNTYFYWKNKKIYYEILEEEKLEDNRVVQFRIKLKWKQNKTNEILEISVKNKKISMLDGIINSWDGDKND